MMLSLLLIAVLSQGRAAGSTCTQGSVMWCAVDGTYSGSTAGNAGECLKSGGAGAPTWGDCSTGGGGAPTDGEYVTYSANASLSAERVLTDGTNTTVDLSVAGQAKVNVSGTVANATLASTATALAANPTDCGANQYANAIAANGNLTCAGITGGQVTGAVATATALAANPAACSAGQYVNDVAADGTLACAQVATTQLSGTITDAQLASSYSGVGTCTNQFVRVLGDNVGPTCGSVNIADHSATGTPSATTFLRGDNTWATPGGGSDPWTYLAVNGGSNFTTSSATVVDVTGLTLTVSANTRYEFECMLLLRTATATVNPRVGLAWSTGLTDGAAVIQELQAATGTPLFASGNPNAALLIAVGGLPNTTQSWPATITATIAAGAGPGGTTRVQLASETAATNVTIQAVGSFCRYRIYT